MELKTINAIIYHLKVVYDTTYFQKYDRECEKFMTELGIDSRYGVITDIAFYSFLRTCYAIEFYKVEQYLLEFLPKLFNLIKIEQQTDYITAVK